MQKDPYNRRRFKILNAISVLENMGCTANSSTVGYISGIDKSTVAMGVSRMADGEVLLSRDSSKAHRCLYKYKLSAKGLRILGKYRARHKAGLHLRLRCDNPIQVDYSDFELLPGLKDHEQEKIKT